MSCATQMQSDSAITRKLCTYQAIVIDRSQGGSLAGYWTQRCVRGIETSPQIDQSREPFQATARGAYG